MGRRLGLVIGVNAYQDAGMQPLQYAETDARALAQWLVHAQGGNWSPADVQLVQGAYATRELAQSLLSRFCLNDAGPGDLLLVYFGGHAYVDERSGEGYLALANTYAGQPETGLSLTTFAQQLLTHSRAAQIVCILDCFLSGNARDQRQSSPYDFAPLLGPKVLNSLVQVPDRILFCSCRGNHQAPEQGMKSLGTFMHHTLLGLCGPASDSETKQVQLQGLYSYLVQKLNEQQRPQVFGQPRSNIPLVGDLPQPQTPFAGGPVQTTANANSSNMPPASPAGQPHPQAGGVAIATAQLSPATPMSAPLNEIDERCAMLMRQARHLLQMQNVTAALSAVEQILQVSPTNIQAMIFKAQLLGTMRRYQEALYLIELVVQLDAPNALAWSIKAALQTNVGLYQEALQSVERSLALDAKNAETQELRSSIMGQIAGQQQKLPQSKRNGRQAAVSKKEESNRFFIGAGLQLLGLVMGIVGAVLLFVPKAPIALDLGLQSFGLALLFVHAAVGSFRYGFARFLVTLVYCMLAAVLLGGAYLAGKTRIYSLVQANPNLLIPLLFVGGWLSLAATAPLLLSIIAWIAGAVARAVNKRAGM